MYQVMDDILFEQSGKAVSEESRWVCRVDERVLTQEDLCALYGCWAEDAIRSGFLAPVRTACREQR